ncbi:MAG: hypothetical protein ABI358_12505 [Ginsengibacter sp.]
MKKFLLISALFLGAFCFKADAQLSVQLNIGRQPVWGPTGYDYVNYYYLPDLDVYYDVNRGVFVYYQYGRWNFAPSLPGRYGRYDLYNSYKVVINDRNPWLRNSYYHSHYYAYRGRRQEIIRDSRDERYWRGRERHDDDHRVIERGNGGRGNERIIEGHGNGGQVRDRGDRGNQDRGNGGGHDNGEHGRGNGGGHGDHNDHQ